MSDDSGAALGERPADDPLELEVARSRIAKALFETGDLVRVGRYQLLQRAGAGGMGVVWSAWDPKLERRVAIKLMHVRNAAAREHMLREGQTLAKLSHPNIVPIFDVGTVDEQVYLVMEWIAGATLRAYCAEPRTTAQVIAVYAEAGAGVAAAHRAGLVQRDFKPDNVMVGDDGRVRLLDFGLAHASDGRGDAAIAGTPRYMAPEQAAGGATTPASDQYSFGVSLRESLATTGEAPAWIAQVIARATAVDPAARYPDMPALLGALARDPAAVWRRRAVVVGACALAVIAFVVGTQRSSAIEPCSGSADELAHAWNPARSAALARHVATLGPYGAAQAPALVAQLSAYGASWTAARRGACLAQHRDEVTPALYERGLACLERSRAALDAVATTLARTPADHLPAAVIAARDLPQAERCLGDATLDPVAPPPRELAALVSAIGAEATRVRYLALAADPASTALAQAATHAAERVGYAPLIARTQIALGMALELDVTSPAPMTAYGAAATAALQGGDDIAFVEAFARRLFIASRRADQAVTSELVAARAVVSPLASRTGEAGRFARALLFNNSATERLAAGDTASAIEWLRKARAEAMHAERGAELWVVLGNLAMLVPDRAERDALFAEERARLERTLGADHPLTFAARVRAALSIDDAREAASRLRELCEPYRRLHPQKVDDIVRCFYELAWLDDDAAIYQRVVDTAAPDDVRVVLARAELARLRGDPRAAIALAEPFARTTERAERWWDRIPAAEAWLIVGSAETDPARAIAAWRAARTVMTEVVRNTQAPSVLRRRAKIDERLATADSSY